MSDMDMDHPFGVNTGRHAGAEDREKRRNDALDTYHRECWKNGKYEPFVPDDADNPDMQGRKMAREAIIRVAKQSHAFDTTAKSDQFCEEEADRWIREAHCDVKPLSKPAPARGKA